MVPNMMANFFVFSIWFLHTVYIGFQLDQVQPCNGCQPTFLDTSGLVAEDLDALLQVFTNFLENDIK